MVPAVIYIVMKDNKEVIRISGEELTLVHIQAIAMQHYGADAAVSMMSGSLIKESEDGDKVD